MFSAQKNAASVTAPQTLYVEDVFSTWLYKGTGATQTITNGINLSGEGGLVWIKDRTSTTGGGNGQVFYDTANSGFFLTSSGIVGTSVTGTSARTNGINSTVAFTSSGFTLGSDSAYSSINYFTTDNYASWTFRKAPKFFDVVQYTGNSANRTIAHNLGVVPGCILVKRTNTTGDWMVYHRSNANTEHMVLNTTAAKATGSTVWNSTTPTTTGFTLGTDVNVNRSGSTYVAYLFAHNTASDGIIQCGSMSVGQVNLGWEPQWILYKNTTGTENWFMVDNMRAMTVTTTDALLNANTTAAESIVDSGINPNATGFNSAFGSNYIYIAIRRGPMKTPTVGTSVFAPNLTTTNNTITTNFPVDLSIIKPSRTSATNNNQTSDRLRGQGNNIFTSSNGSETAVSAYVTFTNNTGLGIVGFTAGLSGVNWAFRRAPGFFDEVCYTGTGANLTLNHNLGVVPELMLVKCRSVANDWAVYSANFANTEYLVLNTTAAKATGATRWNSTTPSATTFTVGTAFEVNTSAATHVAYLFASCPGVSKVGSYTGNGSSQTINCGFAAGARFVLIKRTDSTGDWYVWDTARGIVAGNDPHLSLNTTASEVTTDDTIDTDSTGFIVNQVAATNVNVSSATYIYLAIA